MKSAPETLNQLCDSYQDWADRYYRKPGSRRPTGEARNMHYAMVPLRQVAGTHPPGELCAETLYACQELMISANLSRREINARINRLRRIAKWAANPPRRWIGADVVADLRLVEPLKLGRTEARDLPSVRPVAWEHVAATMAFARLELSTAIELQWHTGMRPGELVQMHKSDLVADGELMLYRPREHKTEHHGVERIIVIGPMGQSVLRPWIRRARGDKLFVWKRTGAYRGAIARINQEHGIPQWSPNQLRHAAATRLRKELGLEAARVILGHTSAATTEIYAEVDAEHARDAMRRFG